MPPSINIKRVAEAAGVSTTTVSFVLNNRGKISEKTRQRVLEAVEQLGYTRSAAAVNLRSQETRVIGYAWDKKRSRFNPVLDNFLYELLRLSEADGRHLLLFSQNLEDGIQPYRQLYESQRVDGFILSHTRQDDERFAYLESEGIPFAAFGRSASPYDDLTHWVDVDGAAGISDAVRHLVEQGFERIAFIGWPVGSVSGDARYHGYTATVSVLGLPDVPGWVVRTTNDIGGGYAAAHQLLGLPNPPDAIVAVSDTVAMGALRCVQEAGRRLGITGFDDTPVAEFSSPTLTSVQQPIEQAAELLTEMLFAQLAGRPLTTRHHLLKPELIIRDSSLYGWQP